MNMTRQEKQESQAKKLKKLIGGVVLSLVLGITAANLFAVIKVGSEASVESFGEVHEKKILVGFNFVLPWWGIDEYSYQHITTTINDFKLASQDKFKTNIDVSVTGNFIRGTADKIRASTGTSAVYLSTHVDKRIQSCLTKAGGDVLNSQEFFEKNIQVQLADSAMACTNKYLKKIGGYEVTAVQFSDIRLDPIVKQFMVLTKERQEGEKQQESALHIKDLIAQEVEKVAAANKAASIDNKDARANDTDADFYAATKQAEANKLMAKSITPDLIKYIEAQRWNGSKLTTGLSASTSVLLQPK